MMFRSERPETELNKAPGVSPTPIPDAASHKNIDNPAHDETRRPWWFV
jgi:hypothetical protein